MAGTGRKTCVEQLSSAALGRGLKDARTTIPGHCSYLLSLLLCVVCSLKVIVIEYSILQLRKLYLEQNLESIMVPSIESGK